MNCSYLMVLVFGVWLFDDDETLFAFDVDDDDDDNDIVVV